MKKRMRWLEMNETCHIYKGPTTSGLRHTKLMTPAINKKKKSGRIVGVKNK